MTCTVADCARAHYAKGLCSAHYNRARRGLPMDKPLRPKAYKRVPPDAVCDEAGCEERPASNGLCQKHHQRAYVRGDTGTEFRGLCSRIGCETLIYAKGMCRNHYEKDRRDSRKKEVAR